MMALYKNTVGAAIKLNCGQDITSATSTTIEVRKPDGSEVSWPATIVESTKLQYVTQEGDLDQAGDYRLQPKLTIGDWTGRGDTAVLKIRDYWQ